MKEITHVTYGKSGETKKVIYSKNIEDDMLLMTACLFKDDEGLQSIVELMCNSTNRDYIENSRSLDETFAMTLCDEEFIDASGYVYYCLMNNIKIIWIPVNNDDISITLSDDYGATEVIKLPEEWKLSKYSTVKGMVVVTTSDERITNIGYRIHELVNIPHRNLEESVLYDKETDKILQGKTILSTKNRNTFDRRSNIFLYTSLEDYAV